MNEVVPYTGILSLVALGMSIISLVYAVRSGTKKPKDEELEI